MLDPQQFYVPKDAGAESAVAQRLESLKKLKAQIKQREASESD
jgi:hypothetical protein